MKRLILLIFALSVAIGPAVATARAVPDGSEVDFRIVSPPTFTDGPAGVCAFSGLAEIVSLQGAPFGTSNLCVERFDENFGPPYRFIEHGHETLQLAAGTIDLTITFVDTYNADFSAAAHRATGRVTGGSGRYAHVTGTMTGRGVITFDASGVAHPRLTYHIELEASAEG